MRIVVGVPPILPQGMRYCVDREGVLSMCEGTAAEWEQELAALVAQQEKRDSERAWREHFGILTEAFA